LRNKSLYIIALLIILSIAIIWIIVGGKYGQNRDEINPTEIFRNQITDINRYSEIRNEIDEKFIMHFPEVVPDNAKDVSFIFVPRIFQGAEIFQIRMELPEEELIELSSYYEENAIVITYGNEFADYDEFKNIQKPIYLLGGEDSHEFTEDYIVYYLGIEAAGSEEFIWNHGELFGISISSTKNIVVYWFEYW
jgi:hypothetical protein